MRAARMVPHRDEEPRSLSSSDSSRMRFPRSESLPFMPMGDLERAAEAVSCCQGAADAVSSCCQRAAERCNGCSTCGGRCCTCCGWCQQAVQAKKKEIEDLHGEAADVVEERARLEAQRSDMEDQLRAQHAAFERQQRDAEASWIRDAAMREKSRWDMMQECARAEKEAKEAHDEAERLRCETEEMKALGKKELDQMQRKYEATKEELDEMIRKEEEAQTANQRLKHLLAQRDVQAALPRTMAYILSIEFASSSSAASIPGALDDIRKGSKGDYIYPIIKRTGDASEAIKGFAFTQDSTPGRSKYVRVDQDLNQGAGGKYNYLWVTKAGDAPVTDIKFYTQDSALPSSRRRIDGWTVFHQDLFDTGGGKYCYLLYKQ